MINGTEAVLKSGVFGKLEVINASCETIRNDEHGKELLHVSQD